MSDKLKLFCIGGVAAGRVVTEMGAYLKVSHEQEPIVYPLPRRYVPCLRHGPGYRRRFKEVFPLVRPPHVEVDCYNRRIFKVKGMPAYEAAYVWEGISDEAAMRELLTYLRREEALGHRT